LKRVGVIINPKAGRGNGKGLALAERLNMGNTAEVVVIERFEQVEQILTRFCTAGVDLICISSGDGTIQHIQTLLAEKLKPRNFPRLCLLPHGTTNMTAADIGFRSRSLAAQAAFIAQPVPTISIKRASLRISGASDGKVRHGMFLGTGAIAVATKYCQVTLNDKGIHGSWATGATLGLGLLRAAFGGQPKDDPSRFDQPHEISFSVDGAILAEGRQLMALCTTLDKLILGSRPFWGGKTADIRCTSLGFPIPSLVRWTIPMMFGNEQRRMPDVAHSSSGRSIALRSSSPYVVDGEFFDGPELHITPGPTIEYILA
jgi:diacylglycerol kinase (ATP)